MQHANPLNHKHGYNWARSLLNGSIWAILPKIFDVFILTLISLNVLAVILGTVEELASGYSGLLYGFEVFSVVIFSLEYIGRLWSCTKDERYKGAVRGRIRFAMSPMALIDLVAILPFYLPMLIPFDARFVRAIRLFRLFRMLKIGRYSDAARRLGNVLRAKREELGITVFAVALLLILASSLMYFVEHEAQPDIFSSIPAAMWWGASTLTTVGYGDIYPITPIGKVLGAAIAVLGIGMFALPAGILASGFAEEIQGEPADPLIASITVSPLENAPDKMTVEFDLNGEHYRADYKRITVTPTPTVKP